jgi:transposase
MPGYRLPPATLQSVLNYIAAGESNYAINRAVGVSRSCIAKLKLSLEYWGTPYPPRCVRLGRPRLLREAQRARFNEYLKGRPSAYLEEMKDFFYDEFDLEVSLTTVWRELERMNYSRKVASKRAREQSEPLRRVYLARMAEHSLYG